MKGLEFPIIGTKVKGLSKRKFDLNSPAGRKKYFKAKVGDEIKHIKKHLSKNTFIAYWLGKKQAGKGTYSKMLIEIFGEDLIAHVSVGDLVRETDNWKKFRKTEKYKRLKSYYRGYVSFEEVEKSLSSRSTKKLLPTEFVLALLKAHIDELQGKTIFIDGLPRSMDQVSYSLYFRDLVAYREDPDVFVLIDIPESVIEERMKYRVICPKCNTSRSPKLLPTSKIGFDTESKEFYLVCDNPNCKGARMIRKEGDDAGLDPIRERLEKDEKLIRTAFKLYGVPKILLRNHVPVDKAGRYFDNYELTPKFSYEWDEKKKKVKVKKEDWIVKDDNGVDCHSLMGQAVVISFIKQLVEVLDL